MVVMVVGRTFLQYVIARAFICSVRVSRVVARALSRSY